MIKKQKQKKTVPPKIVNLSENRKPFNHPPPKKKPNLRLEIWNQNSDLPRVPPANKVRCGICGLIITGGAEGGVTQEMRRQTASPSSTHLFSCYTSACSAATASRRHTINFSLSHPRARTSPRAKHGGVPPQEAEGSVICLVIMQAGCSVFSLLAEELNKVTDNEKLGPGDKSEGLQRQGNLKSI